MSAINPYVPFDGQFRATPRTSEELDLRQIGGAAAQAALIAGIPGIATTLSAAIAALSSPASTATALLVSDARALCHAVERLHDTTYKLNGNK